jgi:diaminohydroxyphosphoribosylaminopyrimidine deaminase/5-amino-6-(5-phosphoribosylamino)uracil reductase
MTTNDERMMRLAVDTACTARLRSRPNPWVGAVVVAQNGEVFTGATLEPGNAHAEIVALNAAAHHAQDSTLFSTAPARKQSSTQACLALLWEHWIQTAKFRAAAYNSCATLASLWM